MVKSLISVAFGLAFGIVLAIVGVVWSAAFAAPAPMPIKHKCTSAVSAAKLQEKLDAARTGDVIEVSGHCVGFNYLIAGDRVTFRGVEGATITGDGAAAAVTVTGLKVTIEGWSAIDGGVAQGIVVRTAGSAIVRNIPLVTGSDGIFINQLAFAEISNVGVAGAADDGIVLNTGAGALISNTDVSNNADEGIVVVGSASVQLAGGNTITNNGGEGLFASGGHFFITGANTVQGNNTDIFCVGFSRVGVFQSIASTTKSFFAPNTICLLFGQNGIPIFVDP